MGRRISISYEGNFLGYGTGQKGTIADFLSDHSNSRQPESKTLATDKVLRMLVDNTLQSKIKKALEGNTESRDAKPCVKDTLQQDEIGKKRVIFDQRSGEWRRSPRRLHLLSFSQTVPRDIRDVFLEKNSGPQLGETGKRRLIGRPLSPTAVMSIMSSTTGSGDFIIGREMRRRAERINRTHADDVKQQLEEFEKKHHEILTSEHQASVGAKVITAMKSGRVQQMVSLKRSPLPLLFQGMSPVKLQKLYATVVGSLNDPLTVSAFSNFLLLLLKPEPPLDDATISWIFAAIDKDSDGLVDFVEFVSLVFGITSAVKTREAFSRLFNILQVDGSLPGRHLRKSSVTHLVLDHISRSDDPDLKKRTLVTAWRITSSLIAQQSQDIKDSDCLNFDEFTVLLYMSTRIMEQIKTFPI